MRQSEQIEVSPPANDAEIDQFVEILIQSLQFTRREEYDWVQRIGVENLRLARRNGRVAGGTILIPMGQWFGGKAVPMVGINGVGVAPDQRGTGVASAMMRQIVRELRQTGVPLSALYPATQPVYRSAGYERAGVRLGYRVPSYSVTIKDRALDVIPFDGTNEAHRAQVERVYRTRAGATNGNLDRKAWNWKRVFAPYQGKSYGYLISRNGEAEGYMFFMQTPAHDHRVDIKLIDHALLTPAAGRRAWSFLADHQSVAEWIKWYGPPAEGWTYHLREQLQEVDWRLEWMLRLVDVKAALEGRGYPKGLDAQVDLEIYDEMFEENCGRRRLVIDDGTAQLTEGGDGRIKIDIKGLAAAYSGHLSAHELAATDLLQASEPDLAVLTTAFAGPAPWMADMF